MVCSTNKPPTSVRVGSVLQTGHRLDMSQFNQQFIGPVSVVAESRWNIGMVVQTIIWHEVCLLLAYVLATFKVIAGWVLTCGSVPDGDFIMLSHWQTRPDHQHHVLIPPTQSHYPNSERSSPCSIILMPSAWIKSYLMRFGKIVSGYHLSAMIDTRLCYANNVYVNNGRSLVENVQQMRWPIS